MKAKLYSIFYAYIMAQKEGIGKVIHTDGPFGDFVEIVVSDMAPPEVILAFQMVLSINNPRVEIKISDKNTKILLPYLERYSLESFKS